MFALIFAQLLNLIRMTGKARFCQGRRKYYRKGGVWIRVACQATFELIVCDALMTLVT